MLVTETDASLFRKLDCVVDEVRNDLCQPVLVRHDDAIRQFFDKRNLYPFGGFQAGRLLDIG